MPPALREELHVAERGSANHGKHEKKAAISFLPFVSDRVMSPLQIYCRITCLIKIVNMDLYSHLLL